MINFIIIMIKFGITITFLNENVEYFVSKIVKLLGEKGERGQLMVEIMCT